ncbi:hypothetical protein K443DRAFT_687269 [Laccaria amethystina LaAM-08-1]|uniref:Uncharacterized protein n=1 Tax=Laccaria amethystina LaAM-08-1 TaxID=1095629 RepID=A0A0C9WGI1_9AGAR|nr:hypothetical protein K443DRAFT_687269 [Laccaria amethystina LaAM-08-1]
MCSKCWLSVYWVTPERQPYRHGIHHKGRLNDAALEKRWEKTKKANVIKFFMQFLDVENAFEGSLGRGRSIGLSPVPIGCGGEMG